MNRIAVTRVVCALAVLSCKGGGGSAEVTRIAQSECVMLEDDLHAAAARHRQFAPALDEHRLDPGQLERATADLNQSSVGVAEDMRRARVSAFEGRFRFCQSLRDLDPNADRDFVVRLEKIDEPLNVDIMSGAMPTAAKTAELLDQLAGLVHDLNARPLKR